MIYAVYTREWPESAQPSRMANWIALLFLLFFIPIANIAQAFEVKEFVEMAQRIGVSDPLGFAHTQIWLGLLVVVIFLLPGISFWHRFQGKSSPLVKWYVPFFLTAYSAFYIILGHFKKGFFHPGYRGQLEQYFYWVILAVIVVIWFISYRKELISEFAPGLPESWKRWCFLITVLLAVIVIIAIISINSHGELPGAHNRF